MADARLAEETHMGNDVVGLAATLELPLAGRDVYAQRFPGLLPGRLGTWEALELLNC